MFIFENRNAHDFTAFFEVLIQLLLVCAEIYIFDENATRVWIVFEGLIWILAFVVCVWL